MAKTKEEKREALRSAILAEVPQIPFLIDQVDKAITWCIEGHDDGVVNKLLSTAVEVARYVKEVSDLNFYKTHLVVAALIGDIEGVTEDPQFNIYRTASHAVENSIKKITIDPALIAERGCFNALNIWLTDLAKKDEHAFVVMLYGILSDLEEIVEALKAVDSKNPITPQNYITVLGYAYVMANLRMANLNLLDKTRVLINRIEVLLNYDVIY